jgi:FKBP-type peptidyl-prolyl cis-trans isomerase
MDSKRSRKNVEDGAPRVVEKVQKRLKTTTTTNVESKTDDLVITTSQTSTTTDEVRPKSKKELRKEKKLLSKKGATASTPSINEAAKTSTTSLSKPISNLPAASATTTTKPTITTKPTSTSEEVRRLAKMERNKVKKERKAATEKALLERQEAQDRLRQGQRAKKEKREVANAKKEKLEEKEKLKKQEVFKAKKEKQLGDKKKKKEGNKQRHDQDFDYDVFSSIIHGSSKDPDGTTTLRLGVKCLDKKVGTGAEVKENSLVNVKYKVTGGRFNTTLDSSNNFTFRVGKGEVIQGWDIGLIGMREGGMRRLTVPPKAGYGSKDIGGGPGATVFFDITLISTRY